MFSPGAESFATTVKSPVGSGWPMNPIGPVRARSTENEPSGSTRLPPETVGAFAPVAGVVEWR